MHVKAQMIFQGKSNLAEDRYVNTFHFNKPWASLEDAKQILGPAIKEFYETPTTTGTKKIHDFMSPNITTARSIRFYDMGEQEPRVPSIYSWSNALATGTGDMPEEIAVVCSFSTVPPITPSRRGRIYIGPLCYVGVSGTEGTNSYIRVMSQVRTTITEAAKRLADGDYGWSVYSQKNGTLSRVMRGWVDDAFDVQRRRGTKPLTRTSWTSSYTGSF